jgi:hypothetical protein
MRSLVIGKATKQSDAPYIKIRIPLRLDEKDTKLTQRSNRGQTAGAPREDNNPKQRA